MDKVSTWFTNLTQAPSLDLSIRRPSIAQIFGPIHMANGETANTEFRIRNDWYFIFGIIATPRKITGKTAHIKTSHTHTYTLFLSIAYYTPS